METLRKEEELQTKLNTYYARIRESPILLIGSQKTLDNAEYKLLLLMLQMRGHFNPDGVPMLSKDS